MKTKIKISNLDYQYKKDVEIRTFLSEISVFETKLLHEIFNQSTKFYISDLEESAETDIRILEQIIDKFSQTGLLMRQKETIFVDKELRKQFELHSIKFTAPFEPDFDFLQKLLQKVPPALQLEWYGIPKTSDTIFDSILEKYAHTPKLYETYLSDLSFDEPLLHHIIRDVFDSPELQVPATELRKRYAVSKEKFQYYLLLLEFHLALTSRFKKEGNQWVEFVCPFQEWKAFRTFERESICHPIDKNLNVEIRHPLDFGFLLDLQALCAYTSQEKREIKNNGPFILHQMESKLQFDHQLHANSLIEKATLLGLIEKIDNHLVAGKHASAYVKLSLQEQAFLLYRKSLEAMQSELLAISGSLERMAHEIQKTVRHLATNEWFFFEEFMKGLTLPIGGQEAVTLKRSGKKWRYVLPSYTERERHFVHSVIFDLLFSANITSCGRLNGKPCFKITPFGHVTLTN